MAEETLNRTDVVYLVSRALFRRLRPYMEAAAGSGDLEVLGSCELAVRRMTEEPDFADPARFLFLEIRGHFSLSEQLWVRRIVDYHLAVARKLIAQLPPEEGRECAAFNRQGSPCRREALPGSEYCPSHRHLEWR
jgi:hypothetical protein